MAEWKMSPPPHPTFQNAPPPLFRAATAKTSDRKACVIMHVQSVQSNVLLVKTHCLNFLTWCNQSDGYKPPFNSSLDHYLSLEQYIFWAPDLTWTLHAVFINYSTHWKCFTLLKMWLKVERSSPQFINLDLLRTKRNENWTLWGSLFSIPIWLVCVIFRGEYYLKRLWFQNSTCRPNFFAIRKNISCTPCTPKISFLNALNRICVSSKCISK